MQLGMTQAEVRLVTGGLPHAQPIITKRMLLCCEYFGHGWKPGLRMCCTFVHVHSMHCHWKLVRLF